MSGFSRPTSPDVTANVASGAAVALAASLTPVDVCFIDVPAGEWNISAMCYLAQSATTRLTDYIATISQASAALNLTAGMYSRVAFNPVNTPQGRELTAPIVPYRVSLTVSTRFYLTAQAQFDTSTASVFGSLRASRAP